MQFGYLKIIGGIVAALFTVGVIAVLIWWLKFRKGPVYSTLGDIELEGNEMRPKPEEENKADDDNSDKSDKSDNSDEEQHATVPLDESEKTSTVNLL